MLDLAIVNLSAQAEAGYEFELEHPATGEGLGGFIKVRGDKSKKVQNHARKRITEMQKRDRVQRGKNKDTDLTIDELEDMAIESAIVRVISWRGITNEGQELQFNEDTATQVFRDHPWIREAVMEASEDLLNFRSE